MFGRSFAAVVCAGILVTSLAHAANDAEADAESLFQQGRKLMEAKRYGEACPKFAASQKAAPGIGTLLNLADCYEKNNQAASAYLRFREAMTLAQKQNKPAREQTARERADKIEPRVIKLTIVSRAVGAEVKVDGTTVETLTTPLPVDPGRHSIEATAKGKKPFATTIDVSERAKAPSVDVPPLEDEAKEAVVVPPETKEPAKEPTVKSPPKAPSNWSTQKTLAVVAGGAGVVALGFGAFFGLKTRSSWNDAQAFCDVTYECDAEGVALVDDAKSSATLSTVSFIVGGALLATGGVLFFTAPKKKASAATSIGFGVGPGSFSLGGRFE